MEAPKTCSLETRKYKSRHNHQNHVISHNPVQLDVTSVRPKTASSTKSYFYAEAVPKADFRVERSTATVTLFPVVYPVRVFLHSYRRSVVEQFAAHEFHVGGDMVK